MTSGARPEGFRLLVLADTHVPVRARDLPAQVWDEVDRADVVLHAGDWVHVDLLDRLEARAARLVGVVGNNDGPALAARLPEVARVDLAGVRIAVVHETGGAAGRGERCLRAFPDTDVLVFGHSHIPWDDTVTASDRNRAPESPSAPGRVLRLLNPGSPTDRRRQPFCTYLTATASDGALADVTVHRVDRRP